ncbi:MAG TPA: tetratricopeptide repeat protein [Pyrinomonadaceae bacterium]|nr:tetratricopeptide repeat protein [Pyrinomonadaceae bacterium]
MTRTLLLLLCLALCAAPALAQRRTARAKAPAAKAAATQTTSARALIVRTEPRAGVWIDGLRRGTTDESGQLVVNQVAPGRHTLRVRAAGFAERSLTLLPAQRGTVEVKLTPTTDEAELAFQRAEDAREGVTPPGATERPDPAELYRRALSLRPRFPAAHVGLARVLLGRDQYDEALEQIKEARLDRPVYPEASAVEGRILRAAADYEAALASYRRAVREGRGLQPEAYAGMGIVYEEQGKYEEAVEAFRKAIAQLHDTEPALYQLLGAAYEKLERWKEAVAAYEKYLQLAPDGRLAPAINSIIDQLRQQAAEQGSPPEQ